MISTFFAFLLLIVLGTAGLLFWSKFRALSSVAASNSFSLSTDRYRPMLRLLSENDLTYVARNAKLHKALCAGRRKIFREYLRCLTRDYARLLAALRYVMVQSGTDRPDLARAIARNRILFAIAICRIEVHLALHASGLSTVDISNLVEALEVLRSQVRVLAAASGTAAA